VQEIICNPDDAKEPWFYKRTYMANNLDYGMGSVHSNMKTVYYPDWKYKPKGIPITSIGGNPIEWDHPVYHVAVNKLDGMKFGVSEIYAALDWARAYKEFLENWSTIVKAYTRFAWNAKTKGGAAGVARMKNVLNTTMTDQGEETNPPSQTASTWIGTEGYDMTPIKTAGATTKAEDGRWLINMVCAATGIFYHYLTGDPSTGNLATAKSMELPMLIMFRDRQQLWTSILLAILNYVIDKSALAPKGLLPGTVGQNAYGDEIVILGNDVDNEDELLRDEPIDRTLAVDFPNIIEKDMEARVKAVVTAATLDGKTLSGTMGLELVAKLLLEALGLDDVDEILDEQFPEGEEPEEIEGETEESRQRIQFVAEMRKLVKELREAKERE
jgi:hypothetical protein